MTGADEAEASAALMELLHRKLESPQTGLLMKIEYYSLYRDITGQAAPQVESGIREQVRYFLLADDQRRREVPAAATSNC